MPPAPRRRLAPARLLRWWCRVEGCGATDVAADPGAAFDAHYLAEHYRQPDTADRRPVKAAA